MQATARVADRGAGNRRGGGRDRSGRLRESVALVDSSNPMADDGKGGQGCTHAASLVRDLLKVRCLCGL